MGAWVPQHHPLATPLSWSCSDGKKNVQESVMQVQSCGFAYSFQPIERFHMTSRWPYWCSKTKKRRPCSVMLVFQTNQVGVELFSYVKNFFCSHKFAYICRCWPREWKLSVAFLPFSLSSPLWHLKVPNDDFLCCLCWLIINKPQPNL